MMTINDAIEMMKPLVTNGTYVATFAVGIAVYAVANAARNAWK